LGHFLTFDEYYAELHMEGCSRSQVCAAARYITFLPLVFHFYRKRIMELWTSIFGLLLLW